jgi:tetratricopeptide (TPR) repeat protein
LKEASRLDPAAPEVQAADAQLKLSRSDWKAAEIQFRRSIATAPSDATSHIAYADALALRGRFDEALREAYLAQQLDPLSPRAAATIASTLRFARRYDEAIVAAEEALRLDPAYGPAFLTLAQCYETKGEFERAIALYQRVGRLTGNLGHAYAVAGRTDEARKLLSVFEQRYKEVGTGAGAIAQIYVGLGDYDRAFEWLQRVVDERGQMSTLKVADVWDPLRSDPRFGTLLVTLGFVE